MQRTNDLNSAGLCSCGRPRDSRPDGSLYFRCPACRAARSKRKAQLVAQGGCRICYYRTAIEGETVCTRCLPLARAADERRHAKEAEKAAKRKAKRARKAKAKARKAAALKARLPDALRCSQKRCNRPRAVKPDGTLYANCDPCRERRSRNQRRRTKELRAMGGCSKCAYRKPLEGDYLCGRCRDYARAEAAEAKELRRLAREIDEWAARPERAFEPTPEDCGISRWNSRKPREANAKYWSPNPDPKRDLDPEWDTYRRFRRC